MTESEISIPEQAITDALRPATQAAAARFEQETGNKPNPLELLLFGRMIRSALEAAAPHLGTGAETTREPASLPLPPCTCQCRQCGFNCHCSECYKTRRAAALQAAINHATTTERARVAELEQLAHDILNTFVQTSDGYRARAGQVQIAKWHTTLNGEH